MTVKRALVIARAHVALDAINDVIGVFHRSPHAAGAHDNVTTLGQ